MAFGVQVWASPQRRGDGNEASRENGPDHRWQQGYRACNGVECALDGGQFQAAGFETLHSEMIVMNPSVLSQGLRYLSRAPENRPNRMTS